MMHPKPKARQHEHEVGEDLIYSAINSENKTINNTKIINPDSKELVLLGFLD